MGLSRRDVSVTRWVLELGRLGATGRRYPGDLCLVGRSAHRYCAMSSCGETTCRALSRSHTAWAVALPDGQVATIRQVPSSRRYASQEILSVSMPCWDNRLSTTSASGDPLSEVFSRVRRAC